MKLFFQSFRHACSGILDVLRGERNFRIELIIGALAIILGAVVQLSNVDWILVILCCMTVLAMECINTAIEKVVDLASPEWHELAKKAKDASAAAVLITALGALIVGILIDGPYIINILKSIL